MLDGNGSNKKMNNKLLLAILFSISVSSYVCIKGSIQYNSDLMIMFLLLGLPNLILIILTIVLKKDKYFKNVKIYILKVIYSIIIYTIFMILFIILIFDAKYMG